MHSTHNVTSSSWTQPPHFWPHPISMLKEKLVLEAYWAIGRTLCISNYAYVNVNFISATIKFIAPPFSLSILHQCQGPTCFVHCICWGEHCTSSVIDLCMWFFWHDVGRRTSAHRQGEGTLWPAGQGTSDKGNNCINKRHHPWIGERNHSGGETDDKFVQ